MSATAVTTVPVGAGETRIVFRGVSYAVYEQLVDALPARAAVRLTFDGEDLEIMVVGGPHDRFKSLMRLVVSVVTEELEIPRADQGSTTWKRAELERGLESDECFHFDLAKLEAAADAVGRLSTDMAR